MSEHPHKATSSNSDKDCNPLCLQRESFNNNNLNEKPWCENHVGSPSYSSTIKDDEAYRKQLCLPGSKVAPDMTSRVEEPKGPCCKKIKIHLDTTDCLKYSKSPTGVAALTTPLAVVRSSRDPHQGLRPRYVKESTECRLNEFVSSKKLYTGNMPSPTCSFESKERSPAKKKNTPSPKRCSKCRPTQMNLITNYFSSENCQKETSETALSEMEMTNSQSNPSGSEERAWTPEFSTQEMSPSTSQSSQRTPSKMFSPLKKVGKSSIYVVECCPDSVSDKKKVSRNVLGSCTPYVKSHGILPVLQTKSTTMLHSDDDSDAFSSSEMNDNDLLDVVDRYGLLGSGRYPCDPVDKTNAFELLPAEVMENIFCFLPVQDLYLNANRVCKAWNQIISNPQFLHWKKKYFQLSKSYGSVRSEMIELLMENGMAEKNDFLKGLIRHMMNHKQLNSDRLLECLQKTPKYHWAIALMNERFMDCFLFGEPHPACVLTILVVIAKSVKDVSNLLTSLLSIQSKCSSIMILEALYCLATFFLAFKLRVRNGIFNGMHYRLYCALYLFENSAGNQGNVQSSLRRNLKEQHLRLGDSNLCLTNEQLRICNYEIRHGEVVKIVAFAGTGKTSTLLALTQIRPSMRFLLVVFNKAMRFHAAKKFPPNVCCKTGHSLAYETVGRRYNTAKKLGGDMKVYEVAQILPPRKGENLYIRSKHVLKTVRTFLASADEYITIDHTPADMLSEQGLKTPISPHLRKNYVVDAQFLWNKMKDIKCSEVKISHDGYLKLYQLRHPKLRNFDCILIDEAQDLTPAVADILLSQDQCKILVGDPHQQIYSFRGAVNALASVQASRVFYLTQSFRFGAEIAGVASTCLEFLKNEGRCLVGSNAPGSVCNDAVGQICIINRTNFGLFSEAVKKCCYSEKEHKIHIIGGFQNFGFSMIQEIYTLTLSDQERRKAGRTITSKLLKHLGSIEALEKYAKDTMDLELSGKVKIVRCYQHNLPTCINAIQWRHVSDEAKADFIFTTAHKAKGLEFPAVRLGIDFITCLTSVQQLIDGSMHSLYTPSEDEKNLLYVAITRAQRVLQVSPALRDILKAAGENFEYIAFSKDLEAAKKPFICSETAKSFQPNALTLMVSDLHLSDGSKITGGMLSPETVRLERGIWADLLGQLPGNSVKGGEEES